MEAREAEVFVSLVLFDGIGMLVLLSDDDSLGDGFLGATDGDLFAVLCSLEEGVLAKLFFELVLVDKGDFGCAKLLHEEVFHLFLLLGNGVSRWCLSFFSWK